MAEHRNMKRKTLLYFPYLNIEDPRTGGELLNTEILKEAKKHDDAIVLVPQLPDFFRNPISLRLYAWIIFAVAILKYRPRSIVTDVDCHSCIFPLFIFTYLLGMENISILHHLTHPERRNAIRRGVERITEKSLLLCSNKVLVISKAEVDQALACGVKKERISLLFPTYHMPSYQPKIKFSDTSIKLLFVGTFYERKGLEILLKALEIINSDNWTLYLAGNIDGESIYTKKILRKIEEHLHSDKIMVLGRVSEEELVSLYHNSDIFVLTSIYEGFGLVVLEAQGYGLPVVASRVGGIPEIVDDGQSGILFPVSDSLACAAALEKLINNPLLRCEMAKNATEQAIKFAGKPSFAIQACDLIFKSAAQL